MKRILLLIGIIIIIILIYIFSSKEGYNNDFSDYKKIDRVKTNKGFRYCLGGNINCKIGNAIHIGDSYSGGSTYKNLCSDDFTQPKCENNLTTNMTMEELSNYNINFVPFPFLQSGFTIDYKDGSTPFILDNSDNINFYNFDYYGNSAGATHKCNLLNAYDKELCTKRSATTLLNTVGNAAVSAAASAKSALLSELDSSISATTTISQAESARLYDIDSSNNAKLTSQYTIDSSNNMYTSGVNAKNALNYANIATNTAKDSIDQIREISNTAAASLKNSIDVSNNAAASLKNSIDASNNATLAAKYSQSASGVANTLSGYMTDSTAKLSSVTQKVLDSSNNAILALKYDNDSIKNKDTCNTSFSSTSRNVCPSTEIWDITTNTCHAPCRPGQTWNNLLLMCK